MDAKSEQESWVEPYYEALAFFYWQPQHLGKKRYDGSAIKTLNAALRHVRGMEVTLNHQIKQFLSLAPVPLRNRLFETALGAPIIGEFTMAGMNVDKEYNLQNTNEPDFLFTANDTTVSMEMKIEAKSSVTQVLKYALLSLAAEQKFEKKCSISWSSLGETTSLAFGKKIRFLLPPTTCGGHSRMNLSKRSSEGS